ncbi:hypothetical protein ACFWVV_36885, partial [Streptomyces sp. NPDC058663]
MELTEQTARWNVFHKNPYRVRLGTSGPFGVPLRCPTTHEVRTPDGRGAYTVFEGGSIYWSAAAGAHPVWGAVRDAWARQGWEGTVLPPHGPAATRSWRRPVVGGAGGGSGERPPQVAPPPRPPPHPPHH